MGLFRKFSDAMNEEFILGERNIARYEADSSALEEILAEQRSRGFGSARALRRQVRPEQARQERKALGLLDVIGVVGIGLAAASLLSDRKDEGDTH
jgi:hypothetical protein